MASKLQKICFHKDGRPRSWQRKLLTNSKHEIRPIFKRVVFKKNGSPRPQYTAWLAKATPSAGGSVQIANELHVREWLESHYAALGPLTTFSDTAEPHRINVVTDSIGPSSLFGGVGTAIILSALWAKRTQSCLRLITRTERPTTKALSMVLEANGIEFDGPVEFVYAPHSGSTEVAIGRNDLFLATSWWTARCLLNTIPSKQIVYLLQEDERMFYPHGDDHLECSNTLAEPFGKVIVNSKLLHQHLTNHPDSIPGLSERSISFEPAFSYPQRNLSSPSKEKRKLFFYARPGNPRNLYVTGLKLINQAVIEGIIDPKEWELHLVGNDLEKIVFDGNLEARYHKPMPWNEYSAFLRKMDAGLSLMYTPHPSYPPIDLAAMGIPVLTNKFGVKHDLQTYSKNIITVDLSMPEMLKGFRSLIDLAENPSICEANTKIDNIERNWTTALADVIEQLSHMTQR